MGDENDCVNSFRNLRKRLSEILREVEDMIDTVQAEKPLYTKIFPVRAEFQNALGIKSGSLSDILQVFLPRWKTEGRIGKGGKYIRVGKEGRLLGFPVEKEVDVYILCNSMLNMLECDI
jgi:hypothetical protein